MLTLDFTPFPELKTRRLLLRQLTPEDAPAIFFLRSDQEVLRYIGKEPAGSLNEATEFIAQISNSIKSNEAIMWGICLQNDPGKIIGTICYWRLQPLNYRAELGYALDPQHWRKGLMKEAIGKILEYGFETMKLHSIEARISPGNIASAAILEATGFVKEGYLKEEFYFRGQFTDSVIYSRLQELK